ncbi:hypothetical protein D7U76_16015 [Stenotrophomonas maltophilia]|nr:hypothetical protein [Stenotrophomonas maltophilia]
MGGGLGPGCRPAPVVVPAAGRQDQHQKLAIRGMAGWVRLRGTLQVRPCKLGRAIHGAHAPATGPTPPSTACCDLSGRRSVLLLVGVDLGRHGRSTPCVDGFLVHLCLTRWADEGSCYGVTQRTGHRIPHGTDPGRHHFRRQVFRARSFAAVGEEHPRCT